MSNFARFQKRNQQYKAAEEVINSEFIFKGYPSTTLVDSLNNSIKAAVVNVEEKDKAYIYTSAENLLNLGETYRAKDLCLLVIDKVTIIKDVSWNKYISLLCNVYFNNCAGYFLGSEKKHISVSLEKHSQLFSNAKPVLVLPNGVLEYNDKVVINNRGWVVEEYDNISSNFVTYYSLRPSTVSEEERNNHIGQNNYIIKRIDIKEQLPLEVIEIGNSIYQIANNTPVTLSTEDGYFKASSKVTIHQHNSNQVSFSIPFGVEEVQIEVLKNGVIQTLTYKAVI